MTSSRSSRTEKIGRGPKAGRQMRFATWHGASGRPPRHDLGRARPDDIVWPSGEGHEIGTIGRDLREVVGLVRRRARKGAITGPVSYGVDGTIRALVFGEPGKRTLACLVADDTQAPGIVAVIADMESDPAKVARAVEDTLGPGFKIRRSIDDPFPTG